jgi:ribosomal protein L20A (L18A)
MNTDETNQIISLLKENLIEKLYLIAGSRPIYASKLRRIIRDDKLNKALKKGGCFSKIASEHKVSRTTVYRKFCLKRKK